MLRLCLLLALTLPIPAWAGDLTGSARVVDGDTLELATPGGEAIIRLHGIDAPERAQTCLDATGAARRCGDEAAAALTALIGGAVVTCQPLDMDRHDRIVARCQAAGRDLGAELVGQGMALAYARYSTDYVTAEAQARAAGSGFWSGTVEPPETYRIAHRPAPTAAPVAPAADCAIKGNISGNGRIYHRPGGRHYDRTGIDEAQGERWFCSPAEAEAAGWRAARG